MNDASGQLSVKGQEHWTTKGPAKLFMWEKRAPGGPEEGHDPVRARLVDGVAADL